MTLPALLTWPLIVGMSIQTGAASDQTQYALLENGQVIEGVIERGGMNTVVIKPSGSRIVFDNRRIACICDSLSEVYWQKCAALRATDFDGHAQLFEWCLQNEQLAEARNQFELLQGMSISAIRLYVLYQRLIDAQTAWEKKQAEQEYENHYAISDLPTTFDADLAIRLVGFESATNRAISPSDRSAILKQLDDTTDMLPKSSVITFKRKIEPLLIHSCFTAKCHDRHAAEMPLEIVSRSGTNLKRLSQRNLLQVLRYTDLSRPLESDLLKAAALPHAGQEKPIIRLNSQQFRILQQWLIEISVSPLADHPLPNHFFETELQVAELPGDDSMPERAPEMIGAFKLPRAIEAVKQAEHEQENQPSSNLGKDPFDPEVFNRRNLKKETDDG